MRRDEHIFDQALALISPEAREGYLLGACGNDHELRRQVDELLAAHQDAGALVFFKASQEPEKMDAFLSGDRLSEQPGNYIGAYKLLQQIGEGGCGVVYMAEQEQPVRRRVALKVIKRGMDTKSVIARFEAERQALAMMDHPNVAKVLDGGSTDAGRPYFIMELVGGVKITDYCDQNNLSTRDRLDLFIKVCQAIQHAHQKGIIHRDIKPSNILVTVNEGAAVPKVIDFGIAKATEGRLTEKTFFTQFEALLGTPAYMSPEQAVMTSLDIDTRSDIYSLGVLLYELLTGETPFDAKALLASGLDEMRKTIREKEPVRPSTKLSHTLFLAESARRVASSAPNSFDKTSTDRGHGAKYPIWKSDKELGADSHRLLRMKETIPLLQGDLDWIVMKCLEKDRSRRYETASGLAADLSRHLKSEPVLARPPNAAYKVRKFVRRNKVMVSAATAFATALVSGVVLIGWMAIQADRAKATAEQQLYSANMNLAQLAWEQGGLDRVRQLLEQTASSKDRGFEWYYWQQQTHQELRQLRAHKGPVLATAISADGLRVVTSSWDHTAKVWDGTTGVTLLTLVGHRAEVGAVAFSPDGLRIVTGSLDETAKIWDSSTGHELLTLKGHSSEISSVAYSPDGLRVVTGSYDLTAKVYDAASSFELLSLQGHKAAISSVAYSPDGLRIITGSHDGTAKLWEASTGNELLALQGHMGAISTVAFSPDGLRIVTGSKDRTAKVWDAASGKELLLLKGHGKAITAAAFFSDGGRIVTASRDQSARMWDASDGRLLGDLKGHTHWINAVAVSANGQRLVTGSEDETAKIWDVSASEKPISSEEIQNPIKAIAIYPNGPVATSAEDSTAKIWASYAGRELVTLAGHSGQVEALAFSPDGQRLVTGSQDHTANVWEVSTGKKLFTLKGHTDVITSVTFSPDGRRIATGSEDRTAIVWDTFTGEAVFSLPGHFGSIRSVGFSPDGRRIITGSQDYSAKVWDAVTRKELFELGGHTSAVSAVAFSRDGLRIATASNDGTAKTWDAVSGNPLHTLVGHSDEVRSVAFSHDGQRVLTGSLDKTAKVWMTDSGRELLTLKGHQAEIKSVGFSKDGRQIVTGGLDRKVKVWEAATPDQVAGWQAEKLASASPHEVPAKWSEQAIALFPEFFCLCDDNQGKGCGNGLGYCPCGKNPGERTMKVFIQSLVDLSKSDDQIRAAMVDRYGEAVKFTKPR